MLFITRKWPPAVGGMEEFSFQVATALSAYADVRVVAWRGRPGAGLTARWLLLGFLVRAVGSLIRHGRRTDMVVLGDFVLAGLSPIARVFAPRASTVITVHGLDLRFGFRSGAGPMLYRAYLRSMVRLRATIDGVVSNSRSTATVAREMGLENVSTVRLGVRPPPIPPAGAKQRDRTKILFVGRLVRRKGAGWFAAEVLPLLAGSEFTVVGAGEDPMEVRQIEASGATTCLGLVDDAELRRLRNSSWVAVVPNIDAGPGDMEGFGLTAIEAAAEGCVVVGADIEGVKDAIVDGVTGFHAPPGDALRWAQVISEIQSWDESQYDAFQVGAAKAVAANYSWDRVAQEVLRAGKSRHAERTSSL